MDPKGKGMVINDKEKESLFNKPKDDKPTDSGSSHKKKDGKKKRRIKKIIYERITMPKRGGELGFSKNQH
jgi:hypothetical protein